MNETSPKPRRTLFFLAFWAALSLLVALASAEIASRYLLPEDPGVVRSVHPYLMNGQFFDTLSIAYKGEGPEKYGYEKISGAYRYSSAKLLSGVADRGEFLFEDRQAVANDIAYREALRIFVVGASAAQGVGASEENRAFRPLLEAMLEKKLGRKVRIINAAAASYVSTQERLVLELMVFPRCPDAVIIFDGFNDANAVELGSRPGDPFNQPIHYEDFFSPFARAGNILAEHSRLLRFLTERRYSAAYTNFMSKLRTDPALFEAQAQSSATVYLDNLFRMLESCRKSGVPCLAFLQPTSHFPKPDAPKTGEEGDWLGKMNAEVYSKVLAAYAEAGKKGWPVHDFTGVFPRAEYGRLFADSVHFKDDGQKIVAEKMFPIVLEALGKAGPRKCFAGWRGKAPDR